ncbi:MAG: 2-amino-4-hydroxy-6-hydroxymethyldihydropteridine diphosphokinase [Candidatus Acidiferrales bacterium]
MSTVYLSLGSNLGERNLNISRAIAGLRERNARVVRESPLYETEPVDLREQPWFLNCVVEAEWDGEPDELLETLHDIERGLGRTRRVRNGPRLIDMDILFFGPRIVQLPQLEIPHPRLAERRFVLVPLNDLAPTFEHPVLRATVADLLRQTADRSEVRPWRLRNAGARTGS